MIFRKDFETKFGYVAALIVCREIRFFPKRSEAVLFLDLYKELGEYEAGMSACDSIRVTIDDAAYDTFISTSGLYTKASNYLIGAGKLLENAEVVE